MGWLCAKRYCAREWSFRLGAGRVGPLSGRCSRRSPMYGRRRRVIRLLAKPSHRRVVLRRARRTWHEFDGSWQPRDCASVLSGRIMRAPSIDRSIFHVKKKSTPDVERALELRCFVYAAGTRADSARAGQVVPRLLEDLPGDGRGAARNLSHGFSARGLASGQGRRGTATTPCDHRSCVRRREVRSHS